MSTKKEHPLENFFNIEQGTTDKSEIEPIKEINLLENFDEMDEDIISDLEEVYGKAISSYKALNDLMMDTEKGAARLGETANQFLGTALDSIKSKIKLKEIKEKASTAVNKTVKNNNYFINTSELVKELKKDATPPIDAPFKVVDNKDKKSEE